MKRILKILAFLSILTVYCFTLGIYSGSSITGGTNVPQGFESGFFTSDTQSGLLFSNGRTETSVNLYNRTSPTHVKNSPNQFSACLFASIKLLNNKYLLCFWNFATSAVQFKSTDIIYPFHYFW